MERKGREGWRGRGGRDGEEGEGGMEMERKGRGGRDGEEGEEGKGRRVWRGKAASLLGKELILDHQMWCVLAIGVVSEK